MKKHIFILVATIAFSLCSYGQDLGKKTLELINNCNCDDVIFISGGLEKVYRLHWRENVELKDGFIVFSKGEQEHYWNTANITFLEKTPKVVRVYLTKSR